MHKVGPMQYKGLPFIGCLPVVRLLCHYRVGRKLDVGKKTSNIFLKIPPYEKKLKVKLFANMIKPLKVLYRHDTKRNNLGNYLFPGINGKFDLFAKKMRKRLFSLFCQFIQGAVEIAITRSMM